MSGLLDDDSEYTRSLRADLDHLDELDRQAADELIAGITPDTLAGFVQAAPVATLPLARQLLIYESGEATLDDLSPAAAASARRRAEAGDETRKRPRLPDAEVAAEVRAMMRRIADARRVIICPPELETRVQAHVDGMSLAGLFEVVASEACPAGEMYLISRIDPLMAVRDFDAGGDAW